MLHDENVVIHSKGDCQCFSMAGQPPPQKKSLLPAGNLDLHLTHGSLGPRESATSNGISIISAVSAGSTDRQTDRSRYSVCSNKPHLAVAAKQPNE